MVGLQKLLYEHSFYSINIYPNTMELCQRRRALMKCVVQPCHSMYPRAPQIPLVQNAFLISPNIATLIMQKMPCQLMYDLWVPYLSVEGMKPKRWLFLEKCYDIKMVELILRGVNFHLASICQKTNKNIEKNFRLSTPLFNKL